MPRPNQIWALERRYLPMAFSFAICSPVSGTLGVCKGLRQLWGQTKPWRVLTGVAEARTDAIRAFDGADRARDPVNG